MEDRKWEWIRKYILKAKKENLQEWKREGFSYYKNEEGETYRLN